MPDPQPPVQPNNPVTPPVAPAAKPPTAPAAPAAKPWHETVFSRDDLRKNPGLTKFKSADDFGASYFALEKKLGDNSRVSLPGPESSEAERAEFYKNLGWPEKPDGYTVFAKVKELLPENTPVNEPFINGAKEAFHKLNLTDAQASGIVSFFAEQQTAALQELGKSVNEGVDQVKAEWGHAYDENLAVAGRAVDQLAEGENAIKGLKELMDPNTTDPDALRMQSHPALIRLFHQLGVWMGEDKRVEGQQQTEQQAQDLAAKKSELMKSEAYWKGDHPDHKSYVAQVKEINDQLAGGQPAV